LPNDPEIDADIEALRTEADILEFDKGLDRVERKCRKKGLFRAYEPQLWELSRILDGLLEREET
jgi:hypothetical protein